MATGPFLILRNRDLTLITEELLKKNTANIRCALGDNIQWTYEARYGVMLSEFAQNKSADVYDKLVPMFQFQWDDKAAKKLPKALKGELKDLARVGKNQKLLFIPQHDNTPAIAAFWWPWGHGGTYSLRLKVLENAITVDDMHEPKRGFLARLISWIRR
ncbi:hypothetical protein [Thalassotalea sediminis]|uniref:hypothetical protein n=1 Tax=Thalassotalea sediminis TaxID=1759089 RepID=UPI002573CCBF|nr:hypothetical protein [Thalassotalea sediminis]